MSSNNILKDINMCLNAGVVPVELDYTLEPQVDMSKLLYNAFYRSYEFQESRLPSGFESIPGSENIIYSLAESARTPLDEIKDRAKSAANPVH